MKMIIFRSINPCLKILLISALLLSSLCSQANAEIITADGFWHEFDVEDLISVSGGLEWIDFTDGSQLTYKFTLTKPVKLEVVDAGFEVINFHMHSRVSP